MKFFAHFRSTRPAYALATILVLLGVALFASGALVTVSILESKISRSQAEGVNAYYASESGIQDALWQFANTAGYATRLQNGTFNPAVTYSSTLGVSGNRNLIQSYSVSILSNSPGFATVTSTGYSNNGDFTAQRVLQAPVFMGKVGAITGSPAIWLGGTVNVLNAAGKVIVSSGDIRSLGAININSGATVTIAGKFNTASATCTTCSSSTVTSSGVQINQTAADLPNFDFNTWNASATQYSSSSLAAFQAALLSSPGLTGPVTVYNGNLSIDNTWALNKTLTVNGLLIVNGSLTVNASGSTLIVNDPGGANVNKGGIAVVNGSLRIYQGAMNVQGTVFSAGTVQIDSLDQITINGALVSPLNLLMTSGGKLNVTFNTNRVGAVLGTGTGYVMHLAHWEEQY